MMELNWSAVLIHNRGGGMTPGEYFRYIYIIKFGVTSYI